MDVKLNAMKTALSTGKKARELNWKNNAN